MTVFRRADILPFSSPPPEGKRMSEENSVSPAKVAAGVVGGAAAAVAGTKLVGKVVGEAGKALGADPEQPNRATQTLTVSASADELFGFFRDATNFQQLLRNVVEVQPGDGRSVHWKVPGPDGQDLEWTPSSPRSAQASSCGGPPTDPATPRPSSRSACARRRSARGPRSRCASDWILPTRGPPRRRGPSPAPWS